THASFPYVGYYGGYPADGYYGLLNPYPYASFGYGVHPYAYPYSMNSGHQQNNEKPTLCGDFKLPYSTFVRMQEWKSERTEKEEKEKVPVMDL
ncbi:hypothetical protein NECAME_11060, partial [Necator americanus]